MEKFVTASAFAPAHDHKSVVAPPGKAAAIDPSPLLDAEFTMDRANALQDQSKLEKPEIELHIEPVPSAALFLAKAATAMCAILACTQVASGNARIGIVFAIATFIWGWTSASWQKESKENT